MAQLIYISCSLPEQGIQMYQEAYHDDILHFICVTRRLSQSPPSWVRWEGVTCHPSSCTQKLFLIGPVWPLNCWVRVRKDFVVLRQHTATCHYFLGRSVEIVWCRPYQSIRGDADALQGRNTSRADDETFDSDPASVTLSVTKSRLYVDCVKPSDAGQYTCVADTPTRRIALHTSLLVGQ